MVEGFEAEKCEVSYARHSFPIDQRLSKNGRLVPRLRGRGMMLSDDYRAAKTALSIALSVAWRKVEFAPKTKTHVGILVRRTDFRSDPANYIDGILDAVSEAIGVDDRYFAMSLDWEESIVGGIVLEVSQ